MASSMYNHAGEYVSQTKQESEQAEKSRQKPYRLHAVGGITQYNMNQQLYSVPTAHTTTPVG